MFHFVPRKFSKRFRWQSNKSVPKYIATPSANANAEMTICQWGMAFFPVETVFSIKAQEEAQNPTQFAYENRRAALPTPGA
jgi:hypothetical protein